MIIQHNIMALNSNNRLAGNNSAVAKNLEKLSSGYKINRAGDDAAGLAISEKMRAQITGLSRASQNAQDGVSLVQTAEGQLTEVHSMLNRMVDLATQASNGTYDVTVDRKNLQKEVQALKDEIDRIADTSNFNGIKLLDGNLGGTDSREVTISGSTIRGLGMDVMGVKITYTAGAGAADAAITGATVDSNGVLNIAYTGPGSGAAMTDAKLETALKGFGFKNAKVTGFTAPTANVTEVKTSITEKTAATIAGTRGDGFKINFEKGATGLTSIELDAVADTESASNADGDVKLEIDTNKSYTASDINKMLANAGVKGVSVDFAGSKDGTTIATGLDLGTARAITDGVGNMASGLSLQIGDTADQRVTVKIGNMGTSALGLDGVDVSSEENAKNSIQKIKDAINSVSGTRADLGAIQNRLEHTINNLTTTTENMTAAESRIRDTNMAQEMMAFTKNNVLAQAAQAMLAQANQQPQQVLQLLR